MGAQSFEDIATGASAKDTFDAVVKAARSRCRGGGYTGSIAEKRSFVLVSSTPLALSHARHKARRMMDAGDARVDGKWGPAGCIPIDDGTSFLFFGWASA